MAKFFVRNIITAVSGLVVAIFSGHLDISPTIVHHIDNILEMLLPMVIGGDTIQTSVKHIVNRKNK